MFGEPLSYCLLEGGGSASAPARVPVGTGELFQEVLDLFWEVLELFLEALSQQSPCERQSEAALVIALLLLPAAVCIELSVLGAYSKALQSLDLNSQARYVGLDILGSRILVLLHT